MIQTIDFGQFCDAFWDTYKDNFTYPGKRALFDYLEQLEEDTGTPIGLDIVALCCDYSEYKSALECIEDCGYELPTTASADDTPEEAEQKALDYLRDNTTVIEFDGGIIIQQF